MWMTGENLFGYFSSGNPTKLWKFRAGDALNSQLTFAGTPDLRHPAVWIAQDGLAGLVRPGQWHAPVSGPFVHFDNLIQPESFRNNMKTNGMATNCVSLPEIRIVSCMTVLP
jgi:hypothetical protein